jgi:hypothetical protein
MDTALVSSITDTVDFTTSFVVGIAAVGAIYVIVHVVVRAHRMLINAAKGF